MTSSATLPHLPAIAPSYSGGSLISHPRKLRLRGLLISGFKPGLFEDKAHIFKPPCYAALLGLGFLTCMRHVFLRSLKVHDSVVLCINSIFQILESCS